jgi:hypothetical protein
VRHKKSGKSSVKKDTFQQITSPMSIASAERLLVKRLSDKATLPVRGSALAAGYDLARSVIWTNCLLS